MNVFYSIVWMISFMIFMFLLMQEEKELKPFITYWKSGEPFKRFTVIASFLCFLLMGPLAILGWFFIKYVDRQKAKAEELYGESGTKRI